MMFPCCGYQAHNGAAVGHLIFHTVYSDIFHNLSCLSYMM